MPDHGCSWHFKSLWPCFSRQINCGKWVSNARMSHCILLQCEKKPTFRGVFEPVSHPLKYGPDFGNEHWFCIFNSACQWLGVGAKLLPSLPKLFLSASAIDVMLEYLCYVEGWRPRARLHRRVCSTVTRRSWDGTRTSHENGSGTLVVTQWRHWVGVTRGGNWRCHPYFFLKKLTFLVIAVCKVMAAYWLFDLVFPLVFLNSATVFFNISFGCPWRVSPGAVRPHTSAPLVTPLFWHVPCLSQWTTCLRRAPSCCLTVTTQLFVHLSKATFLRDDKASFTLCCVYGVPAIKELRDVVTKVSLNSRNYIHLYSPKMVASIEKKNIHTNKHIQ